MHTCQSNQSNQIKFYNQMYNNVFQQQTKQIKTKKTPFMQSHIITYHFHTNNVNELETFFSLCNHLGGYIYMHAPFSTSLDTLLHSSKAEKLLNSICPIVILFTSFALPSTDKFAEKNFNSLNTCLSTFSIFILRILVKHFWGKGNSHGFSIQCQLYLPLFPFIKSVSFCRLSLFRRLSFFPSSYYF